MYLLDLFWFLFFWWCFQVSAPFLLECWLSPRQNVQAGFFCTWTCSSFSLKTFMSGGNWQPGSLLHECWLCHGPDLLWSSLDRLLRCDCSVLVAFLSLFSLSMSNINLVVKPLFQECWLRRGPNLLVFQAALLFADVAHIAKSKLHTLHIAKSKFHIAHCTHCKEHIAHIAKSTSYDLLRGEGTGIICGDLLEEFSCWKLGILQNSCLLEKWKLAQFEPIKYVAHQISNIRMISLMPELAQHRCGKTNENTPPQVPHRM